MFSCFFSAPRGSNFSRETDVCLVFLLLLRLSGPKIFPLGGRLSCFLASSPPSGAQTLPKRRTYFLFSCFFSACQGSDPSQEADVHPVLLLLLRLRAPESRASGKPACPRQSQALPAKRRCNFFLLLRPTYLKIDSRISLVIFVASPSAMTSPSLSMPITSTRASNFFRFRTVSLVQPRVLSRYGKMSTAM